MTIEKNKMIVYQVIDAINRQDTVAIDGVVSPKVAAEIKDALAWIAETWTDHHVDITDMIAEGDKV